MPNAIAYLVLFAWPFIANKIRKKVSVTDAAVLLFLVPYLLLPVKTGVDLPLLPMIDKESMASMVALFLLRKPLSEAGVTRFSNLVKVCWIAIFGGYLITILRNGDPLVFNAGGIPGLRLWDYIAFVFNLVFSFFVPFLVGYRLLSNAQAHRQLVYWIALAGLIYLVPMLWEVRMSPQLHAQLYGFFPRSFGQQIRDGGFRPVVFLGHGLLVAFFAFSACICAYAWLRRESKLWKIPSKYALAALVFGVIACKTLSAVLYLVAGFALLLFVSSSKRYIVMLLLALAVLLYPALRAVSTPYLQSFANYLQEIKPERAQSFEFRLNNEEKLLEKALERPWFGWGSWGRNQIYNDNGLMTSITDGVWIIFFGSSGWVGYLGFFGLLVIPFWVYWRGAGGKVKDKDDIYSTSLLMVLLFNLIDFIPNSSLSHLTLLLAGSLAGAGNARLMLHVRGG